MPFPIAAALAAGASITGGVLQNRANRKAQDRAFNQNREFFNERFDKEASYNHPVQQMARMKEAGLNPSLMYKTGSGASGSTSAPSSQGKIAERYEMGQLAAQSAQVANIIAQTAKTKVETNLLGKNIEGKDISNKTAEVTLAMKQVEESTYSDANKAKVDRLLAEADIAITKANSDSEKLNAWRSVYKDAAAQGMDLTQGPLKIMLQGTVNKYFETSAQVKQFLIELGMNESAYTQFLLQ